jgi:hypothetical protein
MSTMVKRSRTNSNGGSMSSSNSSNRRLGFQSFADMFANMFRFDREEKNNNWKLDKEITNFCDAHSHVSVISSPIHITQGLQDVHAGNPLEVGNGTCVTASHAYQMLNLSHSVSISTPTRHCYCRLRFDNTGVTYFLSPVMMLTLMCTSSAMMNYNSQWTQWFRRLVPDFCTRSQADSVFRFCAGLYDTSVAVPVVHPHPSRPSTTTSIIDPTRRILAHFVVLLTLTTKYRPHETNSQLNIINLLQIALARFFKHVTYNQMRFDYNIPPSLDNFLHSIEHAAHKYNESTPSTYMPANAAVAYKMASALHGGSADSITRVSSYSLDCEGADDSKWWFTDIDKIDFADEPELLVNIRDQLTAGGSIYVRQALDDYLKANTEHTNIIRLYKVNAILARHILYIEKNSNVFAMDVCYPRGCTGAIVCMDDATYSRVDAQFGWAIMKNAASVEMHTVSVIYYIYSYSLQGDVIGICSRYYPDTEEEIAKPEWRLKARKMVAYHLGRRAASVIVGVDVRGATNTKMVNPAWDVLQEIVKITEGKNPNLQLMRRLTILWLCALCEDTEQVMVHLSTQNRMNQIKVVYDMLKKGEQMFSIESNVWEDNNIMSRSKDGSEISLPNSTYRYMLAAEHRCQFFSINKPIASTTTVPIIHGQDYLGMCTEVCTALATLSITGDPDWKTLKTWMTQMETLVDKRPVSYKIVGDVSWPLTNKIFRDTVYYTDEKNVSGLISSIVDNACKANGYTHLQHTAEEFRQQQTLKALYEISGANIV